MRLRITTLIVFVATLGSCASAPQVETAPRDPWNCSSSVDAFGEAIHACKAESSRLLDPVLGLTVFCSSQEGSLPDSPTMGNISHYFSVNINGRDMRLFRAPAGVKVEVKFDDGPVTEWNASTSNGPFRLSQREGPQRGTILHELVKANPDVVALRLVDDDGLRQSGTVRINGMETALSYLEARGGCDRNALV